MGTFVGLALVAEPAVETFVGAVVGIAVVVAVRAPRTPTVSGVAAVLK